MTGVANVSIQPSVPRVINFKAGENDRTQYRPQSQAPVITRPPMNDLVMLQKMIQEQQKKEKNQKLKQNLSWGVGIASGAAIIAMVIAQFKMSKGALTDDSKITKLKESIKTIMNPTIKREAEEELARQPYERSLYRVQDLIQLDKLANTTEHRTQANLEAVKSYMDNEIIGMEEAKEKIYDFLKEVNFDILNNISSGKPIVLCLDGPPGTGKSSLMKTIADALGMYFKKISLGGAKNGEMITGFERTYAGATPGVIAKAQLEGGTKKVLYGFDEAEKAAGNSVLDVLLPIFDNQRIFTDKYYNANVDLSQSMFVLTTNEFKLLPEALRNRVQAIHIGEYSKDVKSKIAKSKLTNELIHNKMNDKVKLADDAYDAIADLTTDKGGRQTTLFVDNLIQKLKGMIIDGQNDITVDKNLIDSLKINTIIG